MDLSSVPPGATMENRPSQVRRDRWDILWRMYQTARAESTSAQGQMHQVMHWALTAGAVLVAAVSFVRASGERAAPEWIVQIICWGAIFLVGWFGATQYLLEVGRMVRAGHFARRIEARLISEFDSDLAPTLLWETHLAMPGNRRLVGYKLSAMAGILAFPAAQAVPFAVYEHHGPLGPWAWCLFPFVGTTAILVSGAWQYQQYSKRFPPD